MALDPMNAREILIVGATGQQGRATIAALQHQRPHSPCIHILALTRSMGSSKSQSLKQAYPDITLVEGDTRTPAPIFATHPDISAIFLVTVPHDEEAQAIPLIDFALTKTHNVNHIVFSSVDRGGRDASWDNPTKVPHFATKHAIELHLRDACTKAAKRWTILRPTGFMDNYKPGFFGSMMASLWAAGLPSDRKTQLISARDIGIFAAKALLDPDVWAGEAVSLASDELTYSQFRDIFKKAIGKDLPEANWLVARGVMWWVEEARTSFEWFDKFGYKADIEFCRQKNPGLQNWEAWLTESSGWKS